MYDNDKIGNKKNKINNPPKHSEAKLNFYRFKNYFNGTIPKIILICVFFFIFVFTISRFGKYILSKDEHDVSEFNTNITYIEKEVVKYYKKHDTSSQNGTIANKTLKELIDSKIINKKKLNNFDKCDLTKSYIKLSRNSKGHYKVTVSTICNGILEEKEDIIK